MIFSLLILHLFFVEMPVIKVSYRGILKQEGQYTSQRKGSVSNHQAAGPRMGASSPDNEWQRFPERELARHDWQFRTENWREPSWAQDSDYRVNYFPFVVEFIIFFLLFNRKTKRCKCFLKLINHSSFHPIISTYKMKHQLFFTCSEVNWTKRFGWRSRKIYYEIILVYWLEFCRKFDFS